MHSHTCMHASKAVMHERLHNKAPDSVCFFGPLPSGAHLHQPANEHDPRTEHVLHRF